MILLVGTVNLAVISAGFTVYHLTLAVTNQTVNERYKLCAMSSVSVTTAPYSNCYHRGILLNLFEEFFPRQHVRSCLSKKIA